MLRHKSIDRICCIVLAATLLLTCAFMGAAASGLIENGGSMGYENRLFDQERVHTIDIVMDDWEGFLETCTNEEYESCTVVIDGEAFGSVAIRAKGNTSLSSVASYGNDRYSFKIEFDHYESGKSYYGLDKLSLNNLIQDSTLMKDYLAYTLMGKMGATAPLCSFVQVNVNGEAWGLYLAVEAVEDSFLTRSYGSDHGELYKPDNLSMGGGRGNGRDFDVSVFEDMFSSDAGDSAEDETGSVESSRQSMRGQTGMSRGGMGSSDVMLQYTDDDPSSYSSIFESAKTDITEADQERLIEALRRLSEGETLEEKLTAVDAEAVIRYLVVHHFMDNDDSYTGSMIHNYYLYEENGSLSMIPWDYNLSFGAFGMGGGFGGSSGATSSVNTPIDTPVSSGDLSSRPILSWIFESEEHTALYHEIYQEFVDMCYADGWLDSEIERVSNLIAPYVEADENGFCTYDEFMKAIETLREYCALRGESLQGQLDGSIPSTEEEQRTNSAALVDASHIDVSDMGSMNMGGGNRGGAAQMPGGSQNAEGTAPDMPTNNGSMALPEGFDPSTMNGMGNMQMPTGDGSMTLPEGFDPSTMNGMGNMQMPTNNGSMALPEGFDPSTMNGMGNMQMPTNNGSMTLPEGFDPSTMNGMGNQPPTNNGGMTFPEGTDSSAQSDASAQITPATEQSDDAQTSADSSAAEPDDGTKESEIRESDRSSMIRSGFSGEVPGMENRTGSRSGASDNSVWLMLAISAAGLLAGLFIAGFHKSGR